MSKDDEAWRRHRERQQYEGGGDVRRSCGGRTDHADFVRGAAMSTIKEGLQA